MPLWKLTVRLEDPVSLNKIVQRDNKKRREPREIRKTGEKDLDEGRRVDKDDDEKS
jgi:hypothetical protein